MNLKSMRIKDKTFIFPTFENDKDKKPAKVIFCRFPLPDENFVRLDKRAAYKGLKIGSTVDEKSINEMAAGVVDNFISNIASNKVDHKAFFEECVDHFEDFDFTDAEKNKRKITTVQDFFKTIPADAAYLIAFDCYKYAMQRDEFSTGELKP